MSGTLVLLLLALFCVAQGSEIHTFQINSISRSSIEDVVALLNKFINDLQTALGRLRNLIQDINNTINDAIGVIDIPGIPANIQKQVGAIIQKAGIDANIAANCIADEAAAVVQLETSLTAEVASCVTVFDGLRNSIEQSISALTSKVTSLVGSITGGITKCFTDHVLNPVKLQVCLDGLANNLTTDVNELIQTIDNEIFKNEEVIVDTTAQLTQCVGEVAQDSQEQELAIINKFQQCVNDIINN